MFTFTPLLGAHSTSTASASLLEFDNGIKILADVGWDSSFKRAFLSGIEKHTNSLSIILLTHATIEHLGAYAHCCKHVPGFNSIPTYATTPVINLGRTLATDLYKSAPPAASLLPKEGLTIPSAESQATDILLPQPTQEEIAGFFSRIYPLKYSQPHQPIPSPFSPPLTGLTITAYGAGHTLGGTIWHLQYGLESIVYAAEWNQTKENLLDGARMLEAGGDEIIQPLQRPTAFICSSRGVERTNVQPPKRRDETLVSLVRETIAQGGKVLIPTDSSARMLELAYVLNTAWRENINGSHGTTYKSANIYMATRSSKATIRYLQSMLEWLEPSVAQAGEAAMTTTNSDINPLHWSHVKKIERASQVERALSRRRPSVLLVSDLSLEWGFSRQALQHLASDSRNLVILTETLAAGNELQNSVASKLWELYQTQQGNASAQANIKVVNAEGRTISLQEAATSDLNDEENSLYQQYIARQIQLHTTAQGDNTLADGAVGGIDEDQAEESSDSEDEDEDAEYQGRALNLSAQMTQNKRKVGISDVELGVNVLLRGKNVYDYDVRNKRGREKMFPFVAHRHRSDEFGDVIRPEEYLRAEERDDGEALDTQNRSGAANMAATGQKRKWDDIDSLKQKKAANLRPAKKVKEEKLVEDKKHEPDYYDKIIAQATGEALESGATDIATNGNIVDQASSSSEDEDDDDESDYEPEEDGPKKVTFSTTELTLQLKIAHVDFTGLAGLTDIVNIVSMIRPRKLIISAGTAEETRALASQCQSIPDLARSDIVTPNINESVEASMDTNAWTLKLSPELVRRLEWQKMVGKGGDMRIASISGYLAPQEETPAEVTEADSEDSKTTKKRIKLTADASASTDTTSGEDGTPLLPLLSIPPLISAVSAPATAAAHPVRVGELRILDLRSHLAALGHDVAVRDLGTLLVDGSVVIRKIPATGRLEVECANAGFARARGRTIRVVPGPGGARQVLDMRGVFFGVREELERALATVN